MTRLTRRDGRTRNAAAKCASCGHPLKLWSREIGGYTRTSVVCSNCQLPETGCICQPWTEESTDDQE